MTMLPIARNPQTGSPSSVEFLSANLSKKQQRILDALPEYGSKIVIRKGAVSMGDLSALTAKTGSEFALFTKRGERLIVRGGRDNTPINVAEAKRLSKEGYRWSGHTHPGRGEVVRLASPADKAILRVFRQKNSVVYDAVGIAEPFGEDYP